MTLRHELASDVRDLVELLDGRAMPRLDDGARLRVARLQALLVLRKLHHRTRTADRQHPLDHSAVPEALTTDDVSQVIP